MTERKQFLIIDRMGDNFEPKVIERSEIIKNHRQKESI